MAAMFKLAPLDAPLELRSTTVKSFPALIGALGVKEIVFGPDPGGSTTNESALEIIPEGFSTSTATFPAICKSAAARVAVH